MINDHSQLKEMQLSGRYIFLIGFLQKIYSNHDL